MTNRHLSRPVGGRIVAGQPGTDRRGAVPYRTDWRGIHELIGEVFMTAVSRRSFLLTGGTAAAAGATATLFAPAAGAAAGAVTVPVGLARRDPCRGRPDLHGRRHHARLRCHHRAGRRADRPGRPQPDDDRQRRRDRAAARRHQRGGHHVRPRVLAGRHRADRHHEARRAVAAAHLPVPAGDLRGRRRPGPGVLRARGGRRRPGLRHGGRRRADRLDRRVLRRRRRQRRQLPARRRGDHPRRRGPVQLRRLRRGHRSPTAPGPAWSSTAPS